MQNIHNHLDFEKVNREFKETREDEFIDCAWTKFIPIHKDVSIGKFKSNDEKDKLEGKCPICEQKLDEKGNRESGASIDHFRPKRNTANSILPKDAYSFLECEESNYILMCKGCNDEYKKSEFPLDSDFVATNVDELSQEKPLLINIREEDPIEYFEIVFTEKYLPLPILELSIKKELSEDSYKFRKAKKTIEFFGLGKCHELEPKKHQKGLCKAFDNRVFTLALHYDALFELAKAIDEERDFEALLNDNPKLMEYGFFRFLIEGQFRIE